MRDTCGATGRTYAAHNTVEGFFCALFKIASLRVCDILHNVKTLGASLCACVATDTAVNFGIKLHHDLFCCAYIFNIVNLLYKREIREGCDIHFVLNLGLASKTSLELVLTLDTVDRSARAAEAVTATATAHELIACVFHRAHDSEVRRNFIFFAKEIDIYHCFHFKHSSVSD